MATPLEVFILIASVFLVSLLWGIKAQKKSELELAKRLGEVFDKKKGGE